MVAAILDIALNGRKIGTITHLGGDRTIFAFTEDYIDDPARPTLSLGFKDEFGGLIADHAPTQKRLPPFFSNLLPEGALRTYLAGRAGVNAEREYHLLEALGDDLPGAVTATPTGNTAPDEAFLVKALHEDEPLRFSLAGVQLKFSAMEQDKQLTIPVNGQGGSWIVKLPSPRFSRLPENEFAMMRLARMVGIAVPEVRLLPLGAIGGMPHGIERLDGNVFAIRRFDRGEDGSKIHIEDFAQILGVYPDRKYQDATYRLLMKILWIETGEAGVAEFVRRLVFNALIGNADMHLKNWSLIHADGRTPMLSPGYDFVSTVAYLPDENAGLKYARGKRMADLSDDELRYMAAKAGVPIHLALDAAHETVVRFRDVWKSEDGNLAMPPEVRAVVERQLVTVPIAAA